MNWKDGFAKNKEIILATASKKNIPNANIVVSVGFVEDKLLVADCQMKTTIKNLKENENICAIGGYFRIKGKAKVYSLGKYFDICVASDKKHKVKNAVLIDIKQVTDLDKVKKIL